MIHRDIAGQHHPGQTRRDAGGRPRGLLALAAAVIRHSVGGSIDGAGRADHPRRCRAAPCTSAYMSLEIRRADLDWLGSSSTFTATRAPRCAVC